MGISILSSLQYQSYIYMSIVTQLQHMIMYILYVWIREIQRGESLHFTGNSLHLPHCNLGGLRLLSHHDMVLSCNSSLRQAGAALCQAHPQLGKVRFQKLALLKQTIQITSNIEPVLQVFKVFLSLQKIVKLFSSFFV